MKRGIVSLVVIAALAFAVCAETLKVVKKDGTVDVYNNDEIERIEFYGGEKEPGTAETKSATSSETEPVSEDAVESAVESQA